jgi:polysaccharide biosynthesis protein PelF
VTVTGEGHPQHCGAVEEAVGEDCQPDADLYGPATRRPQVAFVTEGSYPCSGGGVSVWCDQLMRYLPRVDFHLIAITLTNRDRWVWERPANMVTANHFGLWDRARDRVSRGAPEPCPAALRALIRFLVSRPQEDFDADLAAFADVFEGVLELAADGSLGRFLRFETLCDPVVQSLRYSEYFNSKYEVSLADGLEIAGVMAHLLTPLTIDPGPVDVVHATANGLPALVCLSAQARRNTPFMLTEHGLYLRERYIASDTELARPVLKDFVMRFHLAVAAMAVRRASLLCPASDFNARWQLALGADPAKVTTLYNGVDVSEFPARTADVGRPDVVWLGRIDPLKDLHTLIRSADLVRRDIPSVQYRLFGEEPRSSRGYLASCQSLVRELDLESTVRFEGRSPTSAEAFYAGQFSILSSISEGFPYSVLESMSCGVPVVATSVGGVPEAVADTGYLVPPRDPGSMAQACRRMLASDTRRRRLGVAARERVERLFGIELMLSRHEALYRSWGPDPQLET